MDKLSYRINEAVKATGLGRTKLYELINSNQLPVVKLDGCTLLRRCDLETLLERNLTA